MSKRQRTILPPTLRKQVSRSLHLLLGPPRRREKPGAVLLLAFLLALLLWAFLTLNRSYTTITHYPLRIVGVPDDLQEIGLQTAEVELLLEGTGFNLIWALMTKGGDSIRLGYREEFATQTAVAVSLFTPEIQKQVRAYTRESIGVAQVFTPGIKYLTERKIAKQVPLRLRTDIRLKPAYQLASPPALLTDSVRLFGPPSVLDTIQVWYTTRRPTSPISQAGTIELALDTMSLLRVIPATVQVRVEPRLYTEVHVSAAIQVEQLPPDTELRLDARSVEVFCLVPLDTYDPENNAWAEAVYASVDFTSLDGNYPYFIPQIHVPRPAKLLYFEPQELSYVIVHKP
ncbi:MAG: hypothetical protein OHK0039_38010 [Bacteroidia bacterium]